MGGGGAATFVSWQAHSRFLVNIVAICTQLRYLGEIICKQLRFIGEKPKELGEKSNILVNS
jgi:hypothetical protein